MREHTARVFDNGNDGVGFRNETAQVGTLDDRISPFAEVSVYGNSDGFHMYGKVWTALSKKFAGSRLKTENRA